MIFGEGLFIKYKFDDASWVVLHVGFLRSNLDEFTKLNFFTVLSEIFNWVRLSILGQLKCKSHKNLFMYSVKSDSFSKNILKENFERDSSGVSCIVFSAFEQSCSFWAIIATHYDAAGIFPQLSLYNLGPMYFFLQQAGTPLIGDDH